MLLKRLSHYISEVLLLSFSVLFFIVTACKKNVISDEKVTLEIPLGVDTSLIHIPEDNKLTKSKIDLGRQLFFDERLSVDATISCAFCHNPLLGFSDGRYLAMGVLGQKGPRNSATLLNRVFSRRQFLDGRAGSIEEVILDHIQNSKEMNNRLENLTKTISSVRSYRDAFKTVFDDDVNADRIAKAIASFVRTLITGNSPYDKFIAGDNNAISESAKRGAKLFFSDNLNCKVCHSGPNFTEEKYYNNGAGQDLENPDLGRYNFTKNDLDKGKFRTPTLRNIARTSPYFHNGSVKSLGALVEYYNKGGIANDNLNELIKPLYLSEQEKNDLANFLRSLTGSNTLFMGNL